MAYYSDLTDLKNNCPEQYLKQLSDDSDIDDIDEEKTNDSLRKAQNMIDGFLRGRYTVPLASTNIPEAIRDISTKLATYFLFKRSLLQIVPESIVSDYEDCMKLLNQIQTGRYSPFEVQRNPDWFVSNKVSSTGFRSEQGLVSSTTNCMKRFLI